MEVDMKGLLMSLFFLSVSCLSAQSLQGTWQVVKQSNCMGNELGDPSETEEELLESMSSLSGNAPKTITFNTDGSGEENWRSRGKKKSSSKEKFLYRYTDEALYLLDKKSRLITDTFLVEELTTTSLKMFNKDRACERLELVRVR